GTTIWGSPRTLKAVKSPALSRTRPGGRVDGRIPLELSTPRSTSVDGHFVREPHDPVHCESGQPDEFRGLHGRASPAAPIANIAIDATPSSTGPSQRQPNGGCFGGRVSSRIARHTTGTQGGMLLNSQGPMPPEKPQHPPPAVASPFIPPLPRQPRTGQTRERTGLTW